jgi:hypothetical protein
LLAWIKGDETQPLVLPVIGQVLVQPDFSLTAPMLASVAFCCEQQPDFFSPTAPMLASVFSPVHFCEQLELHSDFSPIAPGLAELLFVLLQPARATKAHTATRFRIDFMTSDPPKGPAVPETGVGKVISDER